MKNKLVGFILLVFVLGAWVACARLDARQAKVKASGSSSSQFLAHGIASIYSNNLQGQRTASGELFNVTELTAAHRGLAFGTHVRVVNKENGREVVVRINDRGPFVAGRLIDLSPAAARRLGFSKAGTAPVELFTS